MKKLRWLPVLAYAGLIFYLSSRPWAPPPPWMPAHADKVIHFCMYFGLGFLLIWAFRATRWKFYSHLLWMAGIISVLYGISDEIHQHFVPGRTPSIADVAADMAGGFIGAYVAVIVARHLRKENRGQVSTFDIISGGGR